MEDESSSGLSEKGYHKSVQLGQGTYGVVYKGIQIATGREVAMKKMRMKAEDGGVFLFISSDDDPPCIDMSAIRELRSLRELSSPYLVELVDSFVHSRQTHHNLWLVYEMMATDLEHIINDRSIPLSQGDIKCYFYRILKGLEYMHANYIVHRDIKPGNLLISSSGELKFGDLGLSKPFGREDVRMTPGAITRPYFFGDTDIEMLSKIVAALGTPKEEDWPGLSTLKGYLPFEETKGTPMELIFTAASPEAIDLMKRLFKFDPNKRETAKKALEHKYFTTGPPMTPCNQLRLPVPGVKNEERAEPTMRSVRAKLENEHVKVKKELTFDADDNDDAMDVDTK